jgi:hypothetical protein
MLHTRARKRAAALPTEGGALVCILPVVLAFVVLAFVASPAQAWTCDAQSFKPIALSNGYMIHEGSASCSTIMELLTVKVCARRHEKDGSDAWVEVGCQSRTNSKRSSVYKSWTRNCGSGWYYKTVAYWFGTGPDMWSNGDYFGDWSAYTVCK